MKIENKKAEFNFTGLLSEVELSVTDKGKTKLDLTVSTEDSKEKITVWGDSDSSYYDYNTKQVVKVTNNINATMEEIEAKRIGKPFKTILKTPKGVTNVYVKDELINKLNELPKSKFYVNIEGTMNFSTYNDKLQFSYNINTIEILPTKPKKTDLVVKVPIYMQNEEVKKFAKYEDTPTEVKVFVKAKGEFVPYKLLLKKSELLGGMVEQVAKSKGLNSVELINEKIMPTVIKSALDKESVCAYIQGKLLIGSIERKPTIEDINPMELPVLEMLGEEAISNKLKEMPLIKTFNESIVFYGFETVESKMFEEAKIVEKTNSESMTSIVGSMLDGIGSSSKEDTLNLDKLIGGNTKKEPIKAFEADEEEMARVIKANESKVEEVKVEEEDEFPF